MSIHCSMLDNQIIQVTHRDLVSVQSLIQAFVELFRSFPSISLPLRILWDGRFASSAQSNNLLYGAIERAREIPQFRGAHLAVIVSGERQYGVARLSQVDLEMEALVVAVFRQIEDGLEWLKLH